MFRGKQVVLLKSQLQTLEICQQNLVIANLGTVLALNYDASVPSIIKYQDNLLKLKKTSSYRRGEENKKLECSMVFSNGFGRTMAD